MAGSPSTGFRRASGCESGSPFHEGEQRAQERVGVRERIERLGRGMVRDSMSDEQREFFEDLPFVVAGSADERGAVWASLLSGPPGFVQAPSVRSLRVRARPLPGDPLPGNLRVGAPLGVLGIELPTRRRNRANGRVARLIQGGFELSVEQSFGNCKQYIHPRAGTFAAPEAHVAPAAEGAELSCDALEVLANADTVFIATSSRQAERGGNEGMDVSHRGGPRGFIHAEARTGATRLTLPDYYGNFMFNTFGNLEVNPHAGLLALDFVSGRVLSLTGTARVLWDDPRVAAFENAERLLEIEVHAGWLWRDVLRGWT